MSKPEKCDKGECSKKFADKAKKPHHGHHHGKPAKPANDACPAKPKAGECCPSKKDKCCP